MNWQKGLKALFWFWVTIAAAIFLVFVITVAWGVVYTLIGEAAVWLFLVVGVSSAVILLGAS